MNLMDILRPYAERPTDVTEDFDDVAGRVPRESLGEGIAEAFRSDRTPEFGSMVASLFGRSDPEQRSGLLAQLIRAVGPAVLSGIAGGSFGRLLQSRGVQPEDGAAPADIGTEVTDRVTPDEVKDLAEAARREDPKVLDRIGAYYAEHPEVVKVLGGTALAIALGQLAQRLKR
jgi:hypothetical protein